MELVLLTALSPLLVSAQSNLRRCYTCRSRGEQGDCRDPFNPPDPGIPGQPKPPHTTSINELPCASGWCSKLLDGLDKSTIDDFGVAHERSCMQRGPSDGKERCAYVKYNHREVYMCFCRGDLCNTSPWVRPSLVTLLLLPLLSTLLWL